MLGHEHLLALLPGPSSEGGNVLLARRPASVLSRYGRDPLNLGTHGRLGYAYLATTFAGLLAERGVGEQDFDRMVRADPARLLTIG